MTEARTRRRLTPERRRRDIVDAAIDLCHEEGLSGVSLTHVAKRLGVAASLISHYFDNAETLLVATFDAAASRNFDAVFALVEAEPDPLARFAVLIDAMLAEDAEDSIALWLDAWALSRRNAVIAQAVEGRSEDWLARAETLVEAGVASGQLTSPDPAESARRLITMLDGLGSQLLTHAAPVDRVRAIAMRYLCIEFSLEPDWADML